MAKLENYNGSVPLIAGITQDGGDFALIEANAVQTREDGTRLDEELAQIAEGVANTSIQVDSELSVTSTNPVQNKVVTAEFTSVYDDIDEVQQGVDRVGQLISNTNQLMNNEVFPRLAELERGCGAGNRIIVTDDGEGNVVIDYAESAQPDYEEEPALEGRVSVIEDALFGAPASDPVVQTTNVTNILQNPQFADGTTNWSMSGGTGVDFAVTDGVLCATQVEPTTKAQVIRSRVTVSDFTLGHKYYMHAKVKYEGTKPPNARLDFNSNNYRTVLENKAPVLGDWCYTSCIVEYILEPSSSLYVTVQNSYSESVSELVGAKCYVDNVMCVDLTAAFGEGNEPDLATMDGWVEAQYADGFTGTTTIALTYEDDGDDDIVEDGGLVGKVATLEADVANLEAAIENLPTAEVRQTGTVYPIVDDYYVTNIETAKPDYYAKQDANTLTFAMMSDMHIKPTSVQTLKNIEASSVWAKLVNHDFVMMGGDFFDGDQPKATSLSYIDTAMEMAEKHANCPVYAVRGNHDINDEAKNWSALTDDERRALMITNKDFYLHANARGEKYGMVTDPAHPYGGYYYVDFDRQKIRMVCLNTSEVKETNGVIADTSSSGRSNYGVKSTNQVYWVRDVALRVPEGWAVMMVYHMPPITGAHIGVTDESTNADNAAPFHNRGNESPAIVAMCEAFASGESGTANVTVSGSVKINYDFTEQGAREFIGHFCGHVHEDSLSTYNGINYVVVNSTTPSGIYDGGRWPTSLPRSEDADKLSLNSFIINRATRTVECVKIGASPSDDNAWWADSFTW